MKNVIRTSDSHPIRIEYVQLPSGWGESGMSFCPENSLMRGPAPGAADLDTDLAVIRDWGAAMAALLIEDHEFIDLQVQALPESVEAHAMLWRHLAIPIAQTARCRHSIVCGYIGEEIIALLRDGSTSSSTACSGLGCN